MEEVPFSDISYKRFLTEEKIMGSKCKKCDALYLPPRPICIKCHSSKMEWFEMKGNGKLSAFTCIAIGPPFMIAEGFNRKHPYCLGVVELEEGVRIDALIQGVDTNRPEGIRVEMPLRAKFLHRESEGIVRTFLAFEPI